MASNPSPSCSDDFVMLDSYQIHGLPLRQRSSVDEAEDHGFDSSSDDDLEHISRPGSVRSLNTPSPSSSPLLVPTAGDTTAVSSLTLQASRILPLHPQIPEHHQAEHDLPPLPNFRNNILPHATPQVQALPPSTCHSHASIDQQIMDHLIERALTARIEQAYGHGSAKDQNLRQQMMTRFRSLPAEHSFVKGSISQIDGSKALFQGQQRSQTELEHVYRLVFTDVERTALNYVVECHNRHFKKLCHFSSLFAPPGRAQPYLAWVQPGAEQSRNLAQDIQSRVLGRLDTKGSFQTLFDDLRRLTRSKIDTHLTLRHHDISLESMMSSSNNEMTTDFDGKARIASDPQHQLKNLECILYTGIADLPIETISFSPSIYEHSIITASKAVKREPPEDDIEPNSACLSPPLKKFQPDTRGRHIMNSNTVSMPKSSIRGAYSVQSPVPPNAPKVQSTPQRMPFESTSQRNQKVEINTQSNHALQDYEVQLRLLEEQNKNNYYRCHLGNGTNRSTQSTVERSDKSNLKPEQIPMSVRRKLQGNRSQTTASLVPQVTDRTSVRSESMALNDHFSAQSRNALAGAEGPNREYRQDTLLAQSTQLPIPSTGISNDKASSWGSDLLLDDKSVHEEGFAASRTRKVYSFAPAIHPDKPSMAINDWKVQMTTLEEDRSRARTNAKESAALRDYRLQIMLLERAKAERERREALENADKLKPKPCSVAQVSNPPAEPSQVSAQKLTIRTHDLGPDYQKQLELLEQQNRFRLMMQREEEQRGRSGGSIGPGTDHPVSTEPGVSESVKRPDYQQQMLMLEEANRQRLMRDREEEVRQRFRGFRGDNGTAQSSNQTTQDRPAPITTYGSGVVTVDEFHKYLMHLEQANRLKLMRQKQEEWMRKKQDEVMRQQQEKAQRSDCGHFASAPLPSHDHVSAEESPCPFRKDKNGISWMAFGHKKEGVQMEFTIRLDVESVDTDMLSWFFKDVNCLHESCEGWASTAERTRQAQAAYLRQSHAGHVNSAEHNRRQDISPDVLRQNLAENKIAWSLAELNPCLRVNGTKDLLRTAVKHFMSMQHSVLHPKQEPESRPVPRTIEVAKPREDPFVLQSPDDIMNDAHLEESSSEEDDEDCSYVSEESAPDSDFPIALIDSEGTRYLTFEFHSSLTSTTSYYTVRADVDSVQHSMSRLFSHHECICRGVWKQQHAETLAHCRDCDVTMALSELNPMLKGKENEKLRWAAMTNYMQMVILDKWPSNRDKELAGDGRILNRVVTQTELEDAYVLFMRAPVTFTSGAQCNYCNLIVDGIRYGKRVSHLAKCTGYARKGEIRMGTDV